MRLFDAIRSFNAALRATASFARGAKSRDKGDLQGALLHAKTGLDILSKRYVRRGNPAEASALISLTILAEEVAAELAAPGVSRRDLTDSITFLRRLEGNPKPGLYLYIPFLEQRLEASNG